MTQWSAKSVAVCRGLSRLISFAVGSLGLAVLAGWIFDVPLLKSVAPGWPAMAPSGAVALVLAAGALWALSESDHMARPRRRAWARTAAGSVAFIGALGLARRALGLNLGIDRLAVHAAGGAYALWPDRISLFAATGFLLLGTATVLLSGSPRPAIVWTAQLCALAAFVGALAAVAGFIYGREALFLVPYFEGTALLTATALLTLSVGVMCARPTGGLMALFNTASAGGTVIRWLLPTALLPLAINWIELEADRRRVFPPAVVWAFDAALTVLLVGMLIVFVARKVHEKDVARQATAEELRESEERFRIIFHRAPVGIAECELATARFTRVNQRYADIVGYTRDELMALTFKDFTHPDDLPKDLAMSQELAAGEIERFAMEKRFLRKGGAIIWVNLVVVPKSWTGRIVNPKSEERSPCPRNDVSIVLI